MSERRPWHLDYDAMVNVKWTPWGQTRVLTVRRRSWGDRIGWDVLQAIKNDLLGREVEAVEVYPAADDVVDEANLRHLWEWPQAIAHVMPFNLNRRT